MSCYRQLLAGLILLTALGLAPMTYAQDMDDSYNPFADYSEFEESAEEEADMNFFRNGRFFTIGFIGGYRGFTETMKALQESNMSYGLFLSYFFDLRLALQVSFLTGDHDLAFRDPANSSVITGNVSLTDIAFNGKYYLNTQNITRGLANLNPYLIGGFSNISRTVRVAGQPRFGKDSVMGFDLGLGIEIPMMRNKSFFGIQASYQLVTFPDESSEILLDAGRKTGLFNKGDILNLNFVLGVSF